MINPTLVKIADETGLARSNRMYPPGRCGNGWRRYIMRVAREWTAPIYYLAKNGDIAALAAALHERGERAPMTTARAMVHSAKRRPHLRPVEFFRNDGGVRLGCKTLHWHEQRGWEHWYMFGARS